MFRQQLKRLAEAESFVSQNQDVEHVEGQGVGGQSVSIGVPRSVQTVLFVFGVYLFERDTYQKLLTSRHSNKLASMYATSELVCGLGQMPFPHTTSSLSL